jgi:hypothetical protein
MNGKRSPRLRTWSLPCHRGFGQPSRIEIGRPRRGEGTAAAPADGFVARNRIAGDGWEARYVCYAAMPMGMVEFSADRSLKHGRVDEGGFGMRVARRVAARAVFDEHALDALAGQLVLVDEGSLWRSSTPAHPRGRCQNGRVATLRPMRGCLPIASWTTPFS